LAAVKESGKGIEGSAAGRRRPPSMAAPSVIEIPPGLSRCPH